MPADEKRSHLYLWAKTNRSDSDKGIPPYHPLACHLLDAAHIALELWPRLPPSVRDRLATQLELSPNDAQRWVAFLVAMHDLGKASGAFQLKVPAFGDGLQSAGLPVAAAGNVPHGRVTAAAFPDLIVELRGLSRAAAKQFAVMIGGHHGIFPTAGDRRMLDSSAPEMGGPRWAQVRRDLVRRIAEVVELPPSRPARPLDPACALVVSGFVTVADWLASIDTTFDFAASSGSVSDSFSLDGYVRESAAKAREVLRATGWTAQPEMTGPAKFDELFGFPPRDLQRDVLEALTDVAPPALAIVEAPMGVGKTEISLALADTWRRHGFDGLYMALPTQATSNQMFTRTREFLGHRYPADVVNLQLLHSRGWLFDDIPDSPTFQPAPSSVWDVDTDSRVPEPGPSVAALEWFLSSKRGLLAPFGVGTLDQALRAALVTKHVFVRLFGLGGKTVVIDEVHAYDTYTTELIHVLLAWLAAVGAPVIILSATLPRVRRAQLLRAYQRGLGVNSAMNPMAAPYPRLSIADSSAMQSIAIRWPAEQSRRVAVRTVAPLTTAGDRDAAAAALASVTADGGNAVVICNTVTQAQQMYRALERHFPGSASDGHPELLAFHAAFPVAERSARESLVLQRYGKNASASGARPARSILVATQVVEQSLDVDFDVMVSELAPIDLLLQRSGRLHRHRTTPRPDRLAKPALWLAQPDAGMEPPSFGKGTEAVYARHVLLRSWLETRHSDHVDIPGDIDRLIEAVYGDVEPPSQGSWLRDEWDVSAAELRAVQDHANDEAAYRRLPYPWEDRDLGDYTQNARDEELGDTHPAHVAMTRLADPSVVAVLLFESHGQHSLSPDGSEPVVLSQKPSLRLARRLLTRSVTVSRKGLVHTLQASEAPQGWRQMAVLRYCRPIVLGLDGRGRIGNTELRLHDDIGLELSRAAASDEGSA